MHLVPAPAVKLMKRRVLSRPGVDSVSVVLPQPLVVHSSLLFSRARLEGEKEEKKKDKTAWRREHLEADSVFALPGLFSNVEAVLS